MSAAPAIEPPAEPAPPDPAHLRRGLGAAAWAAALFAGPFLLTVGAAVLGRGPDLGNLVGAVPALLTAPVFLAALGSEMVGVALWLVRRLPRADRVLYGLPGALVLAGLAGRAGPDLRLAFIAVSAGLVVWFTFLLQYVYRHKELAPRTMRLVRETGLLGIVAALGWFLWALHGSPLLWAATAPFATVVLARGVAESGSPTSGERVPWLLRPGWAVELLLYTFLAEFFVGALLDLEVGGRGFLQYVPFYPVGGPALSAALIQLYDGLWFGAAILASAWFLVALGVTMGGLVVLRMREVHVPAQRYRMGLTIAVFALAAIYVPSLASSTPLLSNRTLASLPVVGWGFGLRAGGPFEAGLFLAILVMYALVGVLTVLFGRKALCSVMCGAALMYQGTTMHEMRQFNQSSRVGQYFLGSRLSTAYVVASTLALASLFAVSLLAALHRLATVQLADGQYDTGALPLPVELYFGGLWFAMFVSTPYVGTYNCATTGMCHWGSLSVPFAKVSFFRLKVKDKTVCQQCTTFDCAKSCPVGLVDMPVYFRTKGEYRSTKCCGVGDCVGACPYGNLYHEDVRSRFTGLWARRPTPKYGSPLPMVAAGPAPSTATASAEN